AAGRSGDAGSSPRPCRQPGRVAPLHRGIPTWPRRGPQCPTPSRATMARRLPLPAVSTTLGELLAGAGLPPPPPGSPTLPVSGGAYDSRRAVRGAVSVAIPGEHTDGHRHARTAVEAGAVAVVAQRPPEPPLPEGVPLVLVPDTQLALAPLAAVLFDHP